MNRNANPSQQPPDKPIPRPATDEHCEDETACLEQETLTGEAPTAQERASTMRDQADGSPLPPIPELPEDDDLWSSSIEEQFPATPPAAQLPAYEFTDEEFDAPSPPPQPPIAQAEPAKPWSLVGHFLHHPNPPKVTKGLQQFVVEDEPDAENAPDQTSDPDEIALKGFDQQSWPTAGREVQVNHHPQPTHLVSDASPPDGGEAEAFDPQARSEEEGEDADFIVEEVGESFPDPEVPIVPGWNPAARIVVYCREQVYQEMYRHALSGLPKNQAAFEIKGVLLGTALKFGQQRIVAITDAVRLPVSPMDRNDQCSYGPVDDDVVRRYLLTHRSLGVVGYYHSHPDHPIFLSVFDIQTLNRRCIQDWSVAVVVQPREHRLGFFVKQRGGTEPAFVSNQKPAATVALSS